MNIVILDGFTLNPGDNSWEMIEQLGNVTLYDRTPNNLIVERAQSADIILTNKVPITKDTLQQLPKLKFISVLATGFNIIDTVAAKEQNVIVSNVPTYSTNAVAQYVFASLLAFIHQPEKHSILVRQGEWSKSKDFCFWDAPLFELNGKTLGLIGMGKTGNAVAKLANAFGMNVIAYSPSQGNAPDISNFSWCSMKTVFEQSDVVSLHCPQTKDNTAFINYTLLSKMKSSALLINSSRGGLINEADLASALNDGLIAGAILDVLSTEPPSLNNPLLTAKNCQITPHIAWAALEARQRLTKQTCENVKAFLEGEPVNQVN